MRKLFGLLVLALALCCTGALAWDTYSYEGEYFCSGCNATVPGRFTYVRFENHHNLGFYCTLHKVDVTDEEPHSFDSDADATCNACGYTREVAEHAHVWSSEWSGTNWYHWHDCTAEGCNLPSNLGEGKDGFGHHTLGEGHTHDGDNGIHKGTCTVCGKTDAVNRLYTVSWKYDDTQHWRECGCGVKEIEGEHWFDSDDDLTCNDDACGYTREVAHEHYGGTATCTEQAVCEGCGESYGEVDPNAHDWGEWEFWDPNKQLGHMRFCKRDHAHGEKNDHTGGNPTCSESATCEGCGDNYVDPNNHAYGTTDWGSYDDTKHVKLCEGCKYVVDRAPHAFDNDADPKCDTCGYTREVVHEHSGGTATCTEQAVCEGCGESYGEVDPDNHDWDIWLFTGLSKQEGHERSCRRDVNHIESEEHTGGNPTCTVQDRCDVCDGHYYDMSNHGDHGTSEWKVYSDTHHYHTCLGCYNNVLTVEHDFDSDLDPKCDTCGYTREVVHEHYGGTATCTEQAVCEGCGESYGEALGHAPGAEATCTTAQVCTREGCGEVLQAAFGHSAVTIEQPKPDCVHASFTNYDECCVCGEILTERKELAPLGHDWVATVIAPTCTEGGYTLHVCNRCGNGYTDTPTEARNHWYGLWSPVDEEQHHADCLRADCEHDKTVDCAWLEIKTDNAQLLVCPVCGDSAVGQFEAIRGAKVKPMDAGAVPAWGEVIVRGTAKPVEGVEFAFTAAYEFAGLVQPFTGAVQFTVPLDEAIVANCLLMRVDAEGLTEMAFTYEDGELTFETDRAAVYLLVTK